MSHSPICDTVESLIVQKAYGETLTDTETGQVEAHVKACITCQESQISLQQLIQGIPKDDFVFEGNLLPAIHETLRQPKPLPWQWIFTSGALVLVLFMSAVFVALPREQGDPVKIENSFTNPVQLAMETAQRAIDSGDDAKAYAILMESVQVHADDVHAGDALLAAGDIAYKELGWYPQAHMIYNRAQSEFYTDFSNQPEAVNRFNVLAEAYSIDAGFESLYSLDAAIGRSTIEALETYISRYPATFTASHASREMALVAIRDAEKAEDWSLADGYEAALSSCTHPLALASLKMELAYEYNRTDSGNEKVRTLLQDVADHGPTILAQRARTSLDELESTTQP